MTLANEEKTASDLSDNPELDGPIHYLIEEAYDSLRPIPKTEVDRRRLAALGGRPLVTEDELIAEIRRLDSRPDDDAIRQALAELVSAEQFTMKLRGDGCWGYSSTFIPIAAVPR